MWWIIFFFQYGTMTISLTFTSFLCQNRSLFAYRKVPFNNMDLIYDVFLTEIYLKVFPNSYTLPFNCGFHVTRVNSFITNQWCGFVCSIPYFHVVRVTIFTLFQIKSDKVENEIILSSVHFNGPRAVNVVRVRHVKVGRSNFTLI